MIVFPYLFLGFRSYSTARREAKKGQRSFRWSTPSRSSDPKEAAVGVRRAIKSALEAIHPPLEQLMQAELDRRRMADRALLLELQWGPARA